MAREARRSAEANVAGRATVDWRYVLFYLFFFVCLLMIALFGIIAEA